MQGGFDVIVIGAGHAGLEAALASARLGRATACITLRLDRIGYLPCNCSIGGPAKGHIAREIDALGGQMAVTADIAITHLRRVGTGKGPSVQTIRAHVCKDLYPATMRAVLEGQPNLTLIQAEVETITTKNGKATGVRLADGTEIPATAVVITTGTFLNGLCHRGQEKTIAARHGDQATHGISGFLAAEGVRLKRFKTGTTPRIRLSTIDFSQTLEMESEPDAGPISYLHDSILAEKPLFPCWQTHTNANTHAEIQANLGQSAMYSGQIQGVGPRYCPSIEDKVVHFATKDSHPVFLERETWSGEEVYVQGTSTSLPADVQARFIRTMKGLENAEIIRPGYAVEYDMADPTQLTAALMSKAVSGLFLAGQINGTSGYEEAAGQGLVAGVNASRYAADLPPVLFPRSESFIGVMIDDLTLKGVDDPYRMLTARSEHRLLLRSDNADARLTPFAREFGLVTEARWQRFSEKTDLIEAGKAALEGATLCNRDADILASFGEAPLSQTTTYFELLKRPSMTLSKVEKLAEASGHPLNLPQRADVREQIELAGLYAGYIGREQRLVAKISSLDGLRIPEGFDYVNTTSLSAEAKEKLTRFRPTTVGQASRIPGIRMGDVALLVGRIQASRKEPLPLS